MESKEIDMKRTTVVMMIAVLAAGAEPMRFDHKVRDMYFAGFNGDKAALTKAMEVSAATLAAEPNHAEAMVWHGGGVFFQSGEKFRAGEMEAAMALLTKGTGMMDKAVELAPRSIGVRIPRGSAYLVASRGMPAEMGRPLLEKGVEDFEVSWEMQKGDLSGFSQHGIGELWIGIADGNARLGKKERATEFFKMIQEKLPNTAWAKKADKWFAEGKLGSQDGRCVGCHTGSPKAFQN